MRTYKLTLLTLVLGLLSHAALADVLNGMTPLKEGELAQLCGGYRLAGGIELNVGIDNSISVNGELVRNSQINLNGNVVTTSSSGVAEVRGANGSTYILQQNAAGLTMIRNTADNVSLSQVRTISIDMTNASFQNLVALHNISTIQAQAINSLRNSVH